jgi:hypothetical protein
MPPGDIERSIARADVRDRAVVWDGADLRGWESKSSLSSLESGKEGCADGARVEEARLEDVRLDCTSLKRLEDRDRVAVNAVEPTRAGLHPTLVTMLPT